MHRDINTLLLFLVVSTMFVDTRNDQTLPLLLFILLFGMKDGLRF